MGHVVGIGDGGGFLLLRSVRADCRFASGWRLIREYYGGMDCVFVIVVTIFVIVMCVCNDDDNTFRCWLRCILDSAWAAIASLMIGDLTAGAQFRF